MKKILLLLLTMVGMVSTASAWNYLAGSFNGWGRTTASCLDGGPIAVYLENGTTYTFGFDAGGTWKAANNNSTITGTTTITSFTDGGDTNFSLTPSVSGYYVFHLTWDNSNPSLTIRYPDTTVYFYNSLNWENVYLHAAWWNGNNGASNKDNLRGVPMSSIGNGIYSAYIPIASLSGCHFTFTKDQQVNFTEDENDGFGRGYANFYNTEVVWNGDITFSASTPLYVPSTTVGDNNKNGCKYYYDVTLHSYPTYTRSVTSGNYGTICLPFAATVEGADIYKIASTVGSGESLKGINISAVVGNEVEAGKAYIFQATSTTLTATYSGSYTEASAGYGMMGNLGSTIQAPLDSYVIGTDNKIHKVTGDAVNVGQYKGYITLTDIEPATARGANFISFDDETTGIKNLTQAQSKGMVFDLQGRRVAQPTKGLYIVNGKKVIK
jgi:hypothetical protein